MSDVDRSPSWSGGRQQYAPQSDGILDQLKDSAGLVEVQKAQEDRAGLILVKKKGIATLTPTIEAETKSSWASDQELAASSRRVAATSLLSWRNPAGQSRGTRLLNDFFERFGELFFHHAQHPRSHSKVETMNTWIPPLRTLVVDSVFVAGVTTALPAPGFKESLR